MYKILLNGKNNIENILEGTLNLSANHVGTFTFAVDPTNPFYKVQELSDNISVLDHNNNYIFDGRILDTTTSFDNVKTIFCESSFAYLNDSVALPYDYQGTLEGYIDMLLEMHNDQSDRKILKGNILVRDKNDYIHYSDINGPKTMEVIQNKIIKRHGGFMFIRRIGGTNYLDYLNKSDLVKHCGQDIELGENLMDVNKERKGSEVYTVIYPTGARPEEDVDAPPINIASVNNGSLFIEDAEAIKKYGRIVRAVKWDKVNEPLILKRKAENMLKDRVVIPEKLTLSALDLSQVASLDSFHLLDHVNVKSSAHDLDQDFIIYKQDIDLINPQNNTIDLSSIEEAKMTGATSKTYSDLEEKLVENDSIYRKAQGDLADRISKASGMYQSKVSTESGEFYYLHDKEELKDSKIVLAINDEAVSLSTDGGKTWNTGLKFNGETITRILKAEGIDASWIRTGEFSLYAQEKIKNVTEQEFADVRNEQIKLSTKITANAEGIQTKVTQDDVESTIEQKADAIRLKANKIAWESTNSSMTEQGTLTCKDAKIEGEVESTSNVGNVSLKNGYISFSDDKKTVAGTMGWITSVAGPQAGEKGVALYGDKDKTDFLSLGVQDGKNITSKLEYRNNVDEWEFKADARMTGHQLIDPKILRPYFIANYTNSDGSYVEGGSGQTAKINFVRVLGITNGKITSYETSSLIFKNGILMEYKSSNAFNV